MDPVIVERFPGMQLVADPGELGWAGSVNASNVQFDLNGTVRTRPGYAQTETTTFTSPRWVSPTDGGAGFAVVGGTAGFATHNAVGARVDTEVVANTPSHVAEASNVSGSARIYIACTGGNLYAYGPTTVALLAATPWAYYLATTDVDNRLVAARSNIGGTPLDSRVHFSAPGNGDTWGTSDWVDLDPRDGQVIRMAVRWGNNLFVFKDRKFAVFYGISTDSTGGAIFNYRSVDSGVGCGYDYAACAAPDGVYFIHKDGVYRTTGEVPQLVSQPLQPFFENRSNGFFTPVGPLTSPRIAAGDDRLYVWQQGATGMFVMDLKTREWTYWVLATAPYALSTTSNARELFFFDVNGRAHMLSPSSTTDAGTAIASHYQSGFLTPARGQQAHVGDFTVTGTGTATLALAADFGAVNTGLANGETSAPDTATMGVSPAVDRAYPNVGAMARQLSFRLSATSGVWAANRLEGRIRSVRDWSS